MGAGYTAIQWNRNKKQYDRVILLFSGGFLLFYSLLNVILKPEITIETLIIRALGSLAILILHIILIVGPLARLDRRFLLLLYNRRHLGVSLFFISLVHGVYSILNFHTLGDKNAFFSLFTSNTHHGSFIHFPFEILGFIALLIFTLMAFTSHDFWLKNLGPRIWKGLHMMVYVAYLLLVFHVILGALQNERSMTPVIILGFGVITVVGLHGLAGYKEYKGDEGEFEADDDGWVKVGLINDITDKRAKIVNAGGQRVAVFRNGRKVSALSNFCRHQGGPIGEGKLIRGAVTCPWHGYQYYAKNGCAPAPFSEKLETYNLKLVDGIIYLDPSPNPAGTEVEPLEVKRK